MRVRASTKSSVRRADSSPRPIRRQIHVAKSIFVFTSERRRVTTRRRRRQPINGTFTPNGNNIAGRKDAYISAILLYDGLALA
jgi:hypothetical protein